MHTYVHYRACIEAQGQLARTTSLLWVLEVELKLSGLEANILTHWANLLASQNKLLFYAINTVLTCFGIPRKPIQCLKES